jgi:glycosyltransferase involved in cell wall biosynthesis
MSLGLVIPLLDEVELAGDVAQGIHSVLQSAKIDHTLVLVDNGSTDGTGALIDALAEQLPVIPVHLQDNAGYGGGILAGLKALQADPPQIVGWCWGDGQIRPDVLPPLYRACIKGAPMAKVVRTERLDGLLRRVVTTGYSRVMLAIGASHPDVNGCPKLFRQEALAALAPRSTDWFLDAEVVLGALSQDWEIATHPAAMAPRAAGRSKVGAATVLEFAWNLARWRLTHRI